MISVAQAQGIPANPKCLVKNPRFAGITGGKELSDYDFLSE